MKVKVTFFGQASDIVKSQEIEFGQSEPLMALGLKKSLVDKYPLLSNIELKLAVNNKLIVNDLELNDGDEISVLPPFSGG